MTEEIRWGSGELKIILDDGSELLLRLGRNGKDIYAERKRDGATEALYGQTWPWDEWPDLAPGFTHNEDD